MEEMTDERSWNRWEEVCSTGSAEAVAQLLVAGYSVHDVHPRTALQPLHAALWSRNGEAAAALVRAGADVNAGWSNQRRCMRPLHLAAIGGLRDLVELLLDHGAELEDRTFHRHTALDSALGAGPVPGILATARLLLHRGCPFDRSEGLTRLLVLHTRGQPRAATQLHPELLELAVELGAEGALLPRRWLGGPDPRGWGLEAAVKERRLAQAATRHQSLRQASEQLDVVLPVCVQEWIVKGWC